MPQDNSVSYKLTLRKYNLALATSSVSEIRDLISDYGKFLRDRDLRVLNLRLNGLSLEEVGNLFGVTGERVRAVEGRALRVISRYSTACSKHPTREDVLSMGLPDFVDLIPPKDSMAVKLRNSLLSYSHRYEGRTLEYLVEHPDDLAVIKNFGVKSYVKLKELLEVHGISLPEVGSLNYVNW